MSIIRDNEVVKSFFEHNGNLVYPITHNLVDMFWGRGFINHARFKFNNGEWVLWNKSTTLPKGFNGSLQAYREQLA